MRVCGSKPGVSGAASANDRPTGVDEPRPHRPRTSHSQQHLAPDRDLVLEAVVVFIGRRGGLDIEVEADRGAVAERRRVDHVVGVDGDPERLQADRPLLDRCLAHEVRPDAGCSELERVETSGSS